LFGAGASFGAGSILPESPPLGGGLFDELVVSYPGSWGRLPDELLTTFRNVGFEAGMRIVFDQYGNAVPQLMREMAVYFIQFRPYQQKTLYCQLVRALIQSNALQNVKFGTLNYECVLEFSLLEAGFAVEYFPGGTSPEAVQVWKPHGSCNMFSQGLQAGPDVSYGTDVVWEGGAQAFFDPNRVIEHCLVETGLAPVMSLYMEGKPLAVSPGVIRQIQEGLAEEILAAGAVFVVGVRPVLADKHIWDPLAQTKAPIFYIGDQTVFERWANSCRYGRVSTFLGNSFSSAFQLLIREIIDYGTD
jgi:hypothetical protein